MEPETNVPTGVPRARRVTPELHRRAGELLEKISTIPEEDRQGFLDTECGADVELRRHVLDLLTAEESAPASFLAKPALEVAASLLSERGGVAGVAQGMQVGVYRIGPLIGQGGMGAVYEGFDTRLQRKAAIKILPAQFAIDPDRVSRFQREARAASQLNHPNIVSIYDAGFDGGYSYIAAELVEGQTLRQLVAAGPLDPKSVLEIGVQLCSALAAAHDARILHRDIKPENIMLRPDGIVKVLDFGLAKLADPISGQTDFHTRPGSIAGTVQYLSPEQVMGKPCGAQSDIFSAGVVLFELTVGSRPFDGPTDGAIFAQIANAPPERASELSRRVNRGFETLILRTLEKDPEFRFQTAHDLRAALRLLMQGLTVRSSQPSAAPIDAPLIPSKKGISVQSLAAAAIVGMALASVVWYALRPEPPAPVPNSFERMTFGEGEEIYPNLFPDGKQFIYASSARGRWDIYLQRTGGSAAINLTPDSTGDNTEPALSRDGTKIAFRSERSGGGLFVMEATGENPRRISSKGHLPNWSPDGKSIVYCDSTYVMPNDRGANVSRLHILDLASNTDRQLETDDAVQPNWSPHGDRIAYWGASGGGKRQIFTVRADGSARPVAVTDGPAIDVNPTWSPSGGDLYFTSDRGGTMNVWRVRINEHTGKTTGSAEPVTTPASYVRFLSWSGDGSKFLYSQGRNRISLSSVEFDPAHIEIVGSPITAGGSNNIGNFSISPDGTKIVHDTVGDPREDLWIVNVDGSGRRKLTSDSYRNRLPSWSPTGEEILFISNRTGQYQEYLIHPDGSGFHALTASQHQVNAGVWMDGGSRIVASMFELGLALVDPRATSPITQPTVLPGLEKSNGNYAFVSPAENGLLIGHMSGTGENPIVLYSLADAKLTRTGVKGTRPVWVPGTKNRYFLFLREDACYSYDRERQQEKRLFATAHNQMYFLQLAPGGRRIYFTQTIREAQIWMAGMPHQLP